jgi:hypothetical protein
MSLSSSIREQVRRRAQTDPSLWNPREEAAIQHFVEQENGQITALTSTGYFTIKS